MIMLTALVLGFGLVLVWDSCHVVENQGPRVPKALNQRLARVDELLLQSGAARLHKRGLVAVSVLLSLVSGLTVLMLSSSIFIAGIFAVFGACALAVILKSRARRRQVLLRDVLPEIVDQIQTGVRAGLSLPETLTYLGERGPVETRREFAEFALDFRIGGAMDPALRRLKESLADPGADRLIEAMRMARQVGGTELGRLLATLSAFLREDARVRAEIEAKQSSTVQAARLALAAPWVVLLMMSSRQESVAAFDTPLGLLILVLGGALSLLAYRIMLRIARLPTDIRVLR